MEGTEEPVGRSWHTLTKISDYQLLLYGGFTQEQTVLSKYNVECYVFSISIQGCKHLGIEINVHVDLEVHFECCTFLIWNCW